MADAVNIPTAVYQQILQGSDREIVVDRLFVAHVHAGSSRDPQAAFLGVTGYVIDEVLLSFDDHAFAIVNLSEGVAPSARLQNRTCGRVGGQRVTQIGTFPTAPLQTVLDRFRVTRLSRDLR